MKIIAEVGSNVKTLDDCFKSISMAKQCGADAVKFQHFTSKEMYGFELPNFTTLLDPDWLPDLKKKADACKIEFMCTFFSATALLANARLLSSIKIASSDMHDIDLLKAAKTTGLPVYISTGGHSLTDCKWTSKFMQGSDFTLMYCESDYPARCTDMRKIGLLKSVHSEIGFSDHSLEIYTNPMLARDLGCKVIEKHVNFTDHRDTPDAPHSLNAEQFARMCKAIKNKESELVYRSVDENHMVERYNKRLIVTKDIAEGDKFKYGINFGAFRSARDDLNGLAPYQWEKVDGKHSNRNLVLGDSIGPREVGL